MPFTLAPFLSWSKLCAGTSHPEKSKVQGVLTSVGFTEEMQNAAVASLSGGWKMKLALGATWSRSLYAKGHPYVDMFYVPMLNDSQYPALFLRHLLLRWPNHICVEEAHDACLPRLQLGDWVEGSCCSVCCIAVLLTLVFLSIILGMCNADEIRHPSACWTSSSIIFITSCPQLTGRFDRGLCDPG